MERSRLDITDLDDEHDERVFRVIFTRVGSLENAALGTRSDRRRSTCRSCCDRLGDYIGHIRRDGRHIDNLGREEACRNPLSVLTLAVRVADARN